MRRFHFVPIGGTAMVPLAAMLREEGHRVTGSDRTLYPPMSTTLERLGIPVADGFAPEHVPADCDAVVVGNAALRDNVEAAEAARRGLLSSPCHRRCASSCCPERPPWWSPGRTGRRRPRR